MSAPKLHQRHNDIIDRLRILGRATVSELRGNRQLSTQTVTRSLRDLAEMGLAVGRKQPGNSHLPMVWTLTGKSAAVRSMVRGTYTDEATGARVTICAPMWAQGARDFLGGLQAVAE